jgi:hypothetical protein
MPDSRIRFGRIFQNWSSCVGQSQRDDNRAITTLRAKGCRGASSALSQSTGKAESRPRDTINTAPFYLVCPVDDDLLRGPGKIAKNTRLVKILGEKYEPQQANQRAPILAPPCFQRGFTPPR